MVLVRQPFPLTEIEKSKTGGSSVEEFGRLTIPDGIPCSVNIRHAFPHSTGIVPKAETRLVVAEMAEPCALLIKMKSGNRRIESRKGRPYIALGVGFVTFDCNKGGLVNQQMNPCLRCRYILAYLSDSSLTSAHVSISGKYSQAFPRDEGLAHSTCPGVECQTREGIGERTTRGGGIHRRRTSNRSENAGGSASENGEPRP